MREMGAFLYLTSVMRFPLAESWVSSVFGTADRLDTADEASFGAAEEVCTEGMGWFSSLGTFLSVSYPGGRKTGASGQSRADSCPFGFTNLGVCFGWFFGMLGCKLRSDSWRVSGPSFSFQTLRGSPSFGIFRKRSMTSEGTGAKRASGTFLEVKGERQRQLKHLIRLKVERYFEVG